MRKAARQKKLHKIKFQKKGIFKLFLYALIAVIFGAILYLILTPAKFWDGESRVAVAVPTKEGEIKILVFDPQTNSINTLIVPATTELNVAHQLGMWKAESVYKLGVNEKVGGRLVSETVTRALRLPTESWAEDAALGFASNNSLVVWKTIFTSFKTNLNIKDKILIGMYSLGVKNTERSEIDLAKTSLLLETKLADGTQGYRVRETNVARISALFGDTQVSEENLNLVIIYPTDRIGVGEKLGEIIQVLGAKVTSLESSDQLNIDCEVIGPESQTRKKIADVFKCNTTNSSEENNIKIQFGEKFIKRF